MKPITQDALKEFLKRFEYFKDAEFRNIEINSPTNITLSFAVQDSSRAYDWISLSLEFDGVSDASLLDNSNLNHVDMSSGIDIKKCGTLFAFKILNSTCHISSIYLKYKQGQF
jgi:hypothetical protein